MMNDSVLNALLGQSATISISPRSAICESYHTFEFTIAVGQGGLSKNDSLGLVCGSNIDRWQFAWPNQYWGQQIPWQTHDPKADGYLTAYCKNRDVSIEIQIGQGGGFKPFQNEHAYFIKSLHARLRYVLELRPQNDLKKGDRITVCWGDTRAGSRGVKAPVTAKEYYFLPFQYSLLPEEDHQLPIRNGSYDQLPTITVQGKHASTFHVSAQPLVGVNETFDVKISALDEYANLDERFQGDISLQIDAEDHTLPDTIHMSAQNKGSYTLKHQSIRQSGWHKIHVKAGPLRGTSNSILVTQDAPTHKIYFGDLHCHPLDCDATVGLERHFLHARDAAGFDFVCVTPHAEYFGCAAAWANYLRMAQKYHQEQSFMTFFGYEWSGQGHCNVYFLDAEKAILFYNPDKTKDAPPDAPPFRVPVKPKVEELMQAIASVKPPVFSIAHCHTRETLIDDSIVTLYEIHSVHDQSHREPHLQRLPRFHQCLASGKHIGICAGSDNHRLAAGHTLKRPGEKWPSPYEPVNCYQTAGLHAMFAPSLSRENLYRAVKARHSYGTDGERIIIILESNGQMMGDQVELAVGQKPTFEIKVGGTKELSAISFWKMENGDWHKAISFQTISDDKWQGTWSDESFQNQAVYYLFVEQCDGTRAWSSPMWFSNDQES